MSLKLIQRFNSTGSFLNHHQNCWSKERMFPERTKTLTCLMATDRSVCCCTVWDRHCNQNKTQFTTVYNEYAFLSDFGGKENNPRGQKTCHWKRATLHSLIHRGTAQISCCIHTFFFFDIIEVNYLEKTVVANLPTSTGNLQGFISRFITIQEWEGAAHQKADI